MKRLLSVIITTASLITTSSAQHEPAKPPSIEGRWDITVHEEEKDKPSWLEISHSGIRTLVGHFVGDGGSARPISEIFVSGNQFNFSIPPQWDMTNNQLQMTGIFAGDSLSGTINLPNGKTWPFSAARAPLLKREKQPVWGTPIRLFNGKDLTGWTALGTTNQWIAENGILRSPKSGANIRTDKTFTDFKLHVEFRYPKHSNSGVYLRGRYEVQVEDSKGVEPWVGGLGAIYGFIKPTENVAKDAGEWQSYDITLVGRMVTVVANGKTIVHYQEIPGITGGALNSKEGEPGPIFFQGDHGPVEYRNIIITPAK